MRVHLACLLVTAAISTQVLTGRQPSALPAQPQDTPTFRTGVELVTLDVVVTDSRGNPVTDLDIDDFEVRERGVVQTVAQFSRVVLPVPAGVERVRSAPAGPVSDVVANDRAQERIYAIVLGVLRGQSSARAAIIVQRFLDDHFQDDDLAAVVPLDHRGPMHFTSDRARLMADMSAVVSRVADSQWRPRPMRNDREVMREARDRARVFGELARSLGRIDARRKSVLFIGDDLGFDPYDAIDNPRSSFSEHARTMLEPIMAAGLAVYPISPLWSGPMDSRHMRALAYVTGGVPTGTGSDLGRTFREIVRDNTAYYILGYSSTTAQANGGYRRVSVRVRRPGMNVRTRDGYFEALPPPDMTRLIGWSGRMSPPQPEPVQTVLTSAITTALASPVPLTAVPMRVFAAPHKTSTREGSVTVAIEIPASGLDFVARPDGTLTGRVDVAIGATSGLNTFRGTEYSFDVSVQPDAHARLRDAGLRVLADVRLNPGEYRLHVAAGSRDGRTGKAFYELTVPDFTAELLAMSGVSLTSAGAAEALMLVAPGVRPTGLPWPPSASREFVRGDTLVLYTELHENVWWRTSDHAITLTTVLRAEDGRTIPMSAEQRSSQAAQLEGGGHAFLARLPLREVEPGAYVLRVEARADFGARTPVIREIPIRVR